MSLRACPGDAGDAGDAVDVAGSLPRGGRLAAALKHRQKQLVLTCLAWQLAQDE